MASIWRRSTAGLGHALGPGVDFADLYFQRSWHESWVLEDGEVKDASYNIDGGVGVRAMSGEKTGFAYSNQISADALQRNRAYRLRHLA